MRSVTKGMEPACLAETRRKIGEGGQQIRKSDYGSLTRECKATLRTALHEEQSGLCAYCCSKIKAEISPDLPATPIVREADRWHPESGGMSIEHWIPQSGYPDSDDNQKVECGQNVLDWSNMLGVCVGVLPQIHEKLKHCDQSRGNHNLSIHPARDRNIENRFKYNKSTGKMDPVDTADKEAKQDIKTLELNTPRLMANRASAIETIRAKIRKDDSPRNIKKLWRLANTPQPDGLPPYAPTIAWYLARKLRAKGISISD